MDVFENSYARRLHYTRKLASLILASFSLVFMVSYLGVPGESGEVSV